MRTASSRALFIIDVQNDFTEGGALGVTGGAAVAQRTPVHCVAGTHGVEYHPALETDAVTALDELARSGAEILESSSLA